MVRRRRVWQAGPWVVAAALLLPAASVFACGVKATLQLAVAEAAPGDQVAGTGAAFSNSHGGGPTAEPVVLRFGSSTGPVLWSGRPNADGTISFTFAVPAAAPGAYVILAIQNNADGEPAPGTPARADFVVLAPPPPATTSTTSQPASTTTVPPAIAVTPPTDIQVVSQSAPPTTAVTSALAGRTVSRSAEQSTQVVQVTTSSSLPTQPPTPEPPSAAIVTPEVATPAEIAGSSPNRSERLALRSASKTNPSNGDSRVVLLGLMVLAAGGGTLGVRVIRSRRAP
jgi:hypothetical protein